MKSNLNLFAYFLIFYLLHIFVNCSKAQQLPVSQLADWNSAGITTNFSNINNTVRIEDFGGKGDGLTFNDIAVQNALNFLSSGGTILFSGGNYLFDKPILLHSNVTLKGLGSNVTILKFSNNLSDKHLIIAAGTNTDVKVTLTANGKKDSKTIQVSTSSGFKTGDYIRISLDDASLVSSSWALGSVGQIERITSVNGVNISIESSLRMDYPLDLSPGINKINPQSKIAIECLKIERTSISTNSSIQVSNIFLIK